MNRRTLTEDEQQLWAQVTRGDTPLADDRCRMTDDKKKSPVKLSDRSFYPPLPVIRHPTPDLPLMLVAYAGIDRNNSERFRKGEMPLDGTIDLHGMSREKAHIALSHFIRVQYDRGGRFLLAVTGKGTASGGRGILRDLLPQWLAEPGLRGMILALDVAKPKHGGSGAYYILLKRVRGG